MQGFWMWRGQMVNLIFITLEFYLNIAPASQMILEQICLKRNVYPSWIAIQGYQWVILERVRTARGPGGETVLLCHLWGRAASFWEHHHLLPLLLATREANRTSCQQLWVFSVQFSLNPEDTHHNYANGAYKEKENTSRHLSETPYGGLKRFPSRCCSLDIIVADAIHYHWKQRSYPAGNNSGRLSVSHPVPSPKWKFTEGIERKSYLWPMQLIHTCWMAFKRSCGVTSGHPHTRVLVLASSTGAACTVASCPLSFYRSHFYDLPTSRLIFPGVMKWCSEIFSEAEAPANSLSS